VVYIIGSASVLIAVPASALQELSGVPDAVDMVASRVGLPLLGGLTGLLVALGALAATSSWTAGAARVPFAAGVDHVLPAGFARIHPRWRTPHVALIVQGLASTAVFLASAFLTVGGRRATLQEAYDVMVNLTILIYFLPYLYLFVSLVKLSGTRGEAVDAEPSRAPGGRTALWSLTLVGLLSTGISMALVFVPPPGTANVATYEASLILQAIAVIGVGVLFYLASGRKTAQ
jgi:amino acid transporter